MDYGLNNGIKNSNNLYKKAKKYIASGTTTFSRSPGVFPDGASPKFLLKQKGCEVWDVDGNKYVDMVMGCGPVTLGHCNKRIDNAIKQQLKKGTLFSLINTLEVELAHNLIKNIPSAEMIKFSKNASDVCAAAVKMARFITKKKYILCYGYHGFQDWYIGSTDRNFGIPNEIRKLTIPFDYNDIQGLKKLFKKYKNNIAAVIMEPVIGQRQLCTYDNKNNQRIKLECCKNCPQKKILQEIRKITKKNKSLLIFDETISGFRFDMGGAQKYFKASSDLSIFGKGLSNGMPLSVLTGKKKYMKHFDKVFLSSTYGPEALSLAAAIENLKIYNKDKVINNLWKIGEFIEENFSRIISKYNLSKFVSLAGYPVRLMINTHDTNGKQDSILASLYQQEMIKNGVLCFSGVLMLSNSHKKKHLNVLINAFDKTCKKISYALESNINFKKLLKCKVMKPVFRGLRERNAVSN
jgi:glutamate-1-semialdehyde aminotransferase